MSDLDMAATEENEDVEVINDLWEIDVECIHDGNTDDPANEANDSVISQNDQSYSKLPSKVPNYDEDFTGFLTEKEFCMETGKHIKNDATPKKTCFNCLGDHFITECPEEKNPAKIAQNKRNILSKKRTSNVRYHEDVENRFSGFQPGVISDVLRTAMHLQENEVPEYIYRMRILGYPPGWLREAQVHRSDVSLFDGSGNAVDHPDDEEGEMEAGSVKYEAEKLISYPGFNSPLPNGFADQGRMYNYPPMQEMHSREAFLEVMNMNKAKKYLKKKLKLDKFLSTTSPDGDFVTPSKGDSSINRDSESSEQLESKSQGTSDASPDKRAKEDGELSEKYSLPGGENPESSDLWCTNISTPDPVTHSPSGEKRKASDCDDTRTGSPLATPKRSSSPTTKRHQRSFSTGFELGVTIPQTISPHTTLPHPDKWAVDVSDHILFANLPDALGTWRKMKTIVSKVQSAIGRLKSSQNE